MCQYLYQSHHQRGEYNLNRQGIRKVAIQEVLSPSLTLTRQYLAVNKIMFKDSVPSIEDIILKPEENQAWVYFPVEGETYYFLVALALEPHPVVNWVGTSPGNRVYFAATSQERNLEELLALARMEPTRTWKKGKKNGKLPRHNGFEICCYEKNTGKVEDKLHILLDVLLPHQAGISRLLQVANIGINIAYYGYKEEMWGIYLDKEIAERLAELQLSVDIDLYAGGPDLEPFE
jgi:hypothetical protein